jgi:integrase
MSRRTGQNGSVERSGKWWVVRWWQDEPGQYKRSHKRAKICPVSGPGSVSKSERIRRAREIVAASGANSLENFNKVVQQSKCEAIPFRKQSEQWLEHLRKRKRKPVANSTIEDWERILRNWINPHIGDCPISDVNNRTLRDLVEKMTAKGLSAKTIDNYLQVPKMVVASVLDDDGNQVLPRKWNNEFIDLPIVESTKQNRPSFSKDVMNGLARWKDPKVRMVFILAGAAGGRIGETLGLELHKHFSSDYRTITIGQKVRHCKVEERVKTASAERQVDLDPRVSDLLREFIGKRTHGFLFESRNGKPLSSSNIIRRHLHPALKALGYINPYTGDYKAGNHAFRRFRNTYLRNETSCPKGLRDYWLGHTGESMDDLYDRVRDDVEFRKKKAEEYGIGFDLPSDLPLIVPKVPRFAAKTKAAKAA